MKQTKRYCFGDVRSARGKVQKENPGSTTKNFGGFLPHAYVKGLLP